MQGNIYITGGGSNEEELPVTAGFLKDIINPNILYIPLALSPDNQLLKKSENWIKDKLKSADPDKDLNITTIKDIKTIPNRKWGGVFVGGGNTFRLMNLLKESGLDKKIINTLATGAPLFGGSAGALICGEWLHLANDPPVGPTDYKGLNIIKDISCCCHYTNDREQQVKNFVEEHNTKVICLTETAGALIKEGKIHSCGKTPLYTYAKCGKEEINKK